MSIFKKQPHEQPNLEQLLSEFNHSLTLIVDRPLLIGNIIAKLKQICAARSVHIFLLDENTGKYKLQNPAEKQTVAFANKDRLITWLSVNECPLLLPAHPDIVAFFSPEEQQALQQLDAELVFPLKIMNHISGMILLGKKTNGRGYSEQEMSLLSILIIQATFALEHASLYADQTERLRKMYRTDRLATLGELAAGAAHEIRNPLTAIRSTIQYLSKDFANQPQKAEMVGELITEVERINKIVQGLLSFARPSELNTSQVSIEQLINQTLLLVSNTLRKQAVAVEFEYFTDHCTIRADAEQLKQVFLNIILNAVEAMGQNAPGIPRTLIISMEKGAPIDPHTRFLLLTFEDSGKGIEEKDIENVFNPFFTTKEEGTGLGLAICYGIINRHGGEIEVQSTLGQGTSIRLKLPQRI